MTGSGHNSGRITRAGLADEIDGFDLQIKALNGMKSDAYKAYREQLEDAGMEPRRAAAEVAATKAAIAKRRKIRENPDEAREKDDLIDAILAEIMGRPSRAREDHDAETGEITNSDQPQEGGSDAKSDLLHQQNDSSLNDRRRPDDQDQAAAERQPPKETTNDETPAGGAAGKTPATNSTSPLDPGPMPEFLRRTKTKRDWED
jgi:hypothetical protein